MRFALILLLLVSCAPTAAPSRPSAVPTAIETMGANAQPTRIVASATATNQPRLAVRLAQVSVERLRADLLTLQSFHTRHSASSTSDTSTGIGAARAWLSAQFRSINPRLLVETDAFAFTLGNRPVGAQNIIATLPGRANPPAIIIISAHYDSRTLDITDVRSAAPGANDDGSGTVAVLELARALSTREFATTFMFILFAGEEEGLYGSTHLAPLMRKRGAHIIAMLNVDIIGNTTGADGTRIADRVRVYSGEPDDGPSRQLAREG